ncbi:MAG: MFS transporter [Actinomycetota bacterium]|nr:MFS transporter [Actinomycetota bacterium]
MPNRLTNLQPEQSLSADPARHRRFDVGPALIVAVLGFFIVTLDALVVNVALPDIGRAMGGGITGLQWVVDGYTLMFAALLLSAGTLSDRIGARQSFGMGLVTFVLASAACGLAPSIGVLIAGRLVQGAGAAVMMPASLALIRENYADPRDRARAIALWSLGAGVASAAGPVVGGFLTLLSWRLIFFVNLPIGALALYLLTRVARSPRQSVPFDWVGQVAAVLGTGALTYGLIEGGAEGFSAPRVVALVLAVVALAVFLVAQMRGTHPMVPLGLFRSRPVSVSVAVGFTFTVGFYGLVFLLSLYFQELRGLSSLVTGLAFIPMTGLSFFVTLLTPRLAERFGPDKPMAVGQVFMAAGLLGLLVTAAGASNLWMSLLTLPVGLGAALAIPTMTALLVDSVPAALVGTGSGVLNTSRQLGGALAIALFGALVAHRETFLHGLRVSLLLAAVLLLATAAASLTLRPLATRERVGALQPRRRHLPRSTDHRAHVAQEAQL